MKTTISTILILLFLGSICKAQDIEFTLANAEITNDGMDDYFEVDVYISSSSDFKLGSGQIYFNYNTLAFGENISLNNNLEYSHGNIGAGSPYILDQDYLGAFPIYSNFVQGDNTDSRMAVSFQQAIGESAFANNITNTPTPLLHLKIKFIDSSEDPLFCFEFASNFDDQFFTACGGVPFADCTNFPGTRLISDAFDCSGGVVANSSCAITTTWTGAAWDNGDPTSTSNVIISGNYNTTVANIEACQLTVTNGATLTIEADQYIKIENDITVDIGASILVEHQGSIVQVNDNALVINNGFINVALTTPLLRPRDFMVLGSPMTLEARTNVFASAFRVLNHDASLFVPHPDVTSQFPDAQNFADDNGDNWQNYSGQIHPAEGFIVYPQPDLNSGNTTYDLNYNNGTLNNGTQTHDLIFNGSQNASPNILSNPYASALSSKDFIEGNSNINEVYFWEHLTTPDQSFPGYSSANFSMEDISMYNLTGGVPAASDMDGFTEPNEFMATGQGFGVKALSAGTATFTNAMRRTQGNTTLRNPEGKDKLWIKVKNSQYQLKGVTLIGFSDETTEEIDPGYDSDRLANIVSIYSHLENGSHELGIQSREAFNSSITIPLGFSTLVDDTTEYFISIENIEGNNLENETVYLIDTLLNIITNLNDSHYQFTSEKGTFNNRFIVLFEPSLNIVNFDSSENIFSIAPNPTNGDLNIYNKTAVTIEQIVIYDLMGRKVYEKHEKSTEISQKITLTTLEAATYILVIHTPNGVFKHKLIKQ